MKKIEDNNTLVFLCDPKASKKQIKLAVQSLYDIKATKVRCQLQLEFAGSTGRRASLRHLLHTDQLRPQSPSIDAG